MANNQDEHHHGTKRYWVIWAALMVFTLITVVTGQIDMGAVNLPLAMVIATTKATLVLLFFMHLYDEGVVNRMILFISVFFVALADARHFRGPDDTERDRASELQWRRIAEPF